MNEIVFVGKHQLTRNVPCHKHSTWEFVYCTNGHGCFRFDGGSTIDYSIGDMVIIPRDTPHSNYSSDGFTNIHLNIRNPALTIKEPILVKDTPEKHISEACHNLLYFYNSAIEGKSLVLSSLGALLISYITIQQKSSNISRIIQEIESNIVKNLSDCDYDLNLTLKQFHFNSDYLRKLFKKELGVTPNRYLIDKRLQSAADIIRSMYYGSNNIGVIANSCGFKDPLYFSKMFRKKYGVSPTLYAKASEESSMLSSENQKIYIVPGDPPAGTIGSR